jgi:3-oxoacyl-[acyl-carrier protein] reductase
MSLSPTALQGSLVLITGGSSGIGEAAVRALHAAGASVCFTYLTHEAEARAIERRLGPEAVAMRCDLADHDALPGLVEACLQRWGRIDVLVNNAAIFRENPFTGTDYAAWRAGWSATFAVNLFAAAHLSWLVLPHMRRRRRGRIINVASRAGHRGELAHADYGASKAALINLTKSLARACAPDGIAAMAVAPGFIDTPMAAADLATKRAEIEAEVPLGRIGTADDVAQVIAFLALPESEHLNGATIDVNGGSYVR